MVAGTSPGARGGQPDGDASLRSAREDEAPATAQSCLLARLDRERAARRRPPAKRDASLMALAAKDIQELDERGSDESVDRAGKALVEEPQRKRAAGGLMVSAQVVAGSDRAALPDALSPHHRTRFSIDIPASPSAPAAVAKGVPRCC